MRLNWWYLSYAEKGFRGVVVIQGSSLTDAVKRSREQGLSPGGEVLGASFQEGIALPPLEYRNRLLSKAEVLKLWPDSISLEQARKEGMEADPDKTDFLCANCEKGICTVH